MLAPWKESYDQPRQHIKKQRHYFADKDPSSQSYEFSYSQVWMWELDNKESWEPKNWCFWSEVLEKTLESPLDYKEIKPVNPKGNQSWWEERNPWRRHWCWERLKAGGQRENSRWDSWMVSPTRWTWVWVSSGSQWWTGKPGVLQSMGSQRDRDYCVTVPRASDYP